MYEHDFLRRWVCSLSRLGLVSFLLGYFYFALFLPKWQRQHKQDTETALALHPAQPGHHPFLTRCRHVNVGAE